MSGLESAAGCKSNDLLLALKSEVLELMSSGYESIIVIYTIKNMHCKTEVYKKQWKHCVRIQ